MARRAIFVACFVAALAAGFAAGVAFSAWRGAHRGSFMGRELDLTEEQSAKMHEIWDNAMEKRRQMHREHAETIKAERIEAVKALLDESKVTEYEAILAAEQARRDAARERSAEIFEQAIDDTVKILTPQQQEKYMEFIAERRQGHARNARRGEGGIRPHEGPPPSGPPEFTREGEAGGEDR